MRRLIYLLAALFALAAAGFAVADEGGPKAVKSVAATFSATSVSNSRSTTCANADGTFVSTKADYAGMASSSDPSLNGPIRLHVRSLINSTKDLGTVDGKLRIQTSGGNTDAQFKAVYAGGKLSGLASGHAQPPFSRLVANLSAGFNAAGGFTNGAIGNTAGGAAVELQSGRCEPGQAQAKTQVEAKGTLSALSQTSITVAGVTCTIPAALAARLSGRLAVGSRAAIRCMLVNGQMTLVKVEPQH